ncbi:glycosyltransferase family 4 protein [Pediococcus acidilactici]
MKYTCEMGPGEDYPGGILTVINELVNSKYLRKFNVKRIVTVSKRNKILKFLESMFYYFFLCAMKRVQLCHIHMSERGSCSRAIILINISSFFNVPVIVHSHGSEIIGYYNSLSTKKKNVFKKAMNYSSKIIILTPGWGEFWGNIVNKNKLVVIPNAVELHNINRKDYNYDNKLNLLFLGFIGDRKGTYDLVRAVKVIIDEYKINNVSLKIAGNGEEDKCKKYVKKLKLENNIDVIGWANKNRKRELLRHADILILPSHFESFGIVVLEALSYKVPVVCGDTGFTKEIISNGKDGFIAKTGNSEDIAIKIIAVSKNLESMGEYGYKKIKSCYSRKIVENKVKMLYEEVTKHE